MRRSIWAVRRFTQLGLKRKLLYAEACLRLVGALVLVRGVPFKLWRTQLQQTRRARRREELTAGDLAFLKDLQHALERIKWASRDRATCLMMVLVARWMMNRRRIPGTIYLGVRRQASGSGLHAHAWMLSVIGVVGHENADDFAIVDRFDSPQSRSP